MELVLWWKLIRSYCQPATSWRSFGGCGLWYRRKSGPTAGLVLVFSGRLGDRTQNTGKTKSNENHTFYSIWERFWCPESVWCLERLLSARPSSFDLCVQVQANLREALWLSCRTTGRNTRRPSSCLYVVQRELDQPRGRQTIITLNLNELRCLQNMARVKHSMYFMNIVITVPFDFAYLL